MKRYTLALSLTSFIYLFIGVTFLYQSTVLKKPTPQPLTSVEISLYTPKEAPLEEPQHQEETPKTPEPKNIPPQVRPKPSNPKPAPKKETMVEPPKESFAINETTNEKPVQEPAPAIAHTQEVSKESLQTYQKNYLEDLRRRINGHKIYPKVAQTSHIEGSVKVEFTISPKGELLSFVILEGKKIFHKATEEAIQKSFPFPLNEDLFTSSMTFQIELSYTLL
jgi:TonB family protein